MLSVLQLFRKIWFLTVIGSLFNFFSRIEGNVFLPYLYSRVKCCGDFGILPKRYDVTDPQLVRSIVEEAAQLKLDVPWPSSGPLGGVIPACDVPTFPAVSTLWSLSPTCNNKAYVQNVAQNLVGINTPLQKSMSLVLMPVSCAIADATGRRGVLKLHAISCALACLLYLVDTTIHSQSTWRDILVLVAGMLLCTTWEPKDAVIASSIADLTGHNEQNKSRALYMMQSLGTLGTTIGFVGAFICLRSRLESYTVVWAIFAGIAFSIVLVAAILVPETLPQKLVQPLTWAMVNPTNSHWRSMQLICRDHILVMMAVNDFLWGFSFVGGMGIVLSYLVMIGFSTASAMGPGITCTLLEIFFAAAVVPVVPVVGVYACATAGHVMLAVGWFIFGPVTLLAWRSFGPYLAATCLAAGYALYYPAKLTIVSQRVERAHQGKCQAGLLACCVLGIVAGMPLYSRVLFDGTAQGLHRALPMLVSMGISICCATVSLYVACAAAAIPSAAEMGSDLLSDSEIPDTLSKTQGPYGAI